MVTEKDFELIQKYLNRNYPIQRIKINGKFKRAILFDNGRTYLVSNPNDKPYLKKEMITAIETVFGFETEETKKFVSKYLKY